MSTASLTGFVYLVTKDCVPVRGRWQIRVDLPPEPAFDEDGICCPSWLDDAQTPGTLRQPHELPGS